MNSPTDGLPWPVVLLLAVGTLAALYGISVLLSHREQQAPDSPAAPAAVPAGPVPVRARDTAPYHLDAGVTVGGAEAGRYQSVSEAEGKQ